MVLSLVLSCLAVCLISTTVDGADPSVGWCYHLPSCNESTWPSIAGAYCNGTRQSPVNIVTASVKANEDLTALKFKGFNDSTALTEIKNSGREVKVILNHEKMAVEGGALPGVYNSRQFHLHWGSGSSVPGAEHTVDGKQYAMELHIVNVKAEYSSTADALADPTGLAALGFLIEATNDTGKPKSWKTLTSYLANIPNAGDTVALTQSISMDSLLEGVNRSRYYRYLGSLTVPNCNEAVVWTVFKDPVRVSHDLVDLFSTRLYVNKSTNSPLMTNTFRRTQSINSRVVTSQSSSSSSSSKKTDSCRFTGGAEALKRNGYWTRGPAEDELMKAFSFPSHAGVPSAALVWARSWEIPALAMLCPEK
ncbi:carbonic anhydrase 4-like [Colossoma macropomum]|uniref:carbonic anhydrase 4-like n=1 Tax=Colossoma macropomum TaxID=42526 RepID=UPI001864D62A|nr:carbonic anhydrase 4-like [Colossoma macropomum]